jgi:hypothetical protein
LEIVFYKQQIVIQYLLILPFKKPNINVKIDMKAHLLCIVFCNILATTFGQYNDPNYAKPSSGYGADGTHSVGKVAFSNPKFPTKDIEIYYPTDIHTSVPTIFYSHAYGGTVSANISGLLNFVAMKGYAIVYVPYQTFGVSVYDRYDNLLNGFQKAAREYSSIIDTTKVGFLGHSFGGGASFGLAYHCFTQNNWGKNGRFIYALAQWYSYNISESELQSFPTNTKLITEIFEDDVTNDHRMAIDIFNTISIPDDEKDFLLLKSDTVLGHVYAADHVMPNTSAAFDAFDYYGYYRLLDALCDYTFNGSLAGKNVALGNGSVAQIIMPIGLKNMVQTDNPKVVFPQDKYEFRCDDTLNLRSNFCPTILGFEDVIHDHNTFLIYPNPASSFISVKIPAEISSSILKIYDSFGRVVLVKWVENQLSNQIDLSSISKGIYFIEIGKVHTKLLID